MAFELFRGKHKKVKQEQPKPAPKKRVIPNDYSDFADTILELQEDRSERDTAKKHGS